MDERPAIVPLRAPPKECQLPSAIALEALDADRPAFENPRLPDAPKRPAFENPLFPDAPKRPAFENPLFPDEPKRPAFENPLFPDEP
jgi:hypothetical protein